MRRKRTKEMLLASGILLVLILLGSMSNFLQNDTPTGAVTGKTDVYGKCLAHGKDKTGKWHWDWIKACRDFVEEKEKIKGKAIPRTYTSQDAYNEFIEKYGTVDEDQP
jgi:hypothetical protein